MTPPPSLPGWLLSGPVRRLLDILSAGGEEARAVGGAVRNWLMGHAPGDVDIATTAQPERVLALLAEAGLKAVPTGLAHGTVTAVVDGVGYEVTTLREDVETDGRHAVVRFGRDWRKDAARRDFTINAMSLSRDGALHDFFGGAADLAAGRVRFIGDPVVRIREDRLRILRFFRFHAGYGRGEPDRAALAACIAEREGLGALSRERVRAEMLKLLVLPQAAAVLQVMADAGLLGRVLGGVPLAAHVGRLAAIEAHMGLPPDAVRRLAALAVLVREDAERLRQRLALSNEELRRLDGVGAGWASIDPIRGELAAKTVLFHVGPRGFRDRALVAFARSGAAPDDPAWGGLVTLPDRWRAPAFPVTGEALMRRGVAHGPAVGEALARIRRAWIAAGFPTQRQAVASLVDRVLGAPES